MQDGASKTTVRTLLPRATIRITGPKPAPRPAQPRSRAQLGMLMPRKKALSGSSVGAGHCTAGRRSSSPCVRGGRPTGVVLPRPPARLPNGQFVGMVSSPQSQPARPAFEMWAVSTVKNPRAQKTSTNRPILRLYGGQHLVAHQAPPPAGCRGRQRALTHAPRRNVARTPAATFCGCGGLRAASSVRLRSWAVTAFDLTHCTHRRVRCPARAPSPERKVRPPRSFVQQVGGVENTPPAGDLLRKAQAVDLVEKLLFAASGINQWVCEWERKRRLCTP